MGELLNRIATDNAPPRRRFRLVLDLHADNRDELDRVLTSLSFAVHDDSVTERTSGGFSSGYHLELDEDPAVDHTSYVQALAAWHQERLENPDG